MSSLRTRILATYALVAVLPLTFAAIVALGLFVRYERQATLVRRGVLLAAVTDDLADIAGTPRQALTPEFQERVRRQATALRGRLLVVNASGRVLFDTVLDGTLLGKQLRLPAQAALRDASGSPTWSVPACPMAGSTTWPPSPSSAQPPRRGSPPRATWCWLSRQASWVAPGVMCSWR